MSATYSSFDTLTIGHYEGGAAPGGPMLPVLAEIPALGSKPTPAKPPEPELQPASAPAVQVRPEPAHAPQVASPEVAAPQFQAAPQVQSAPQPAPAPAEAFAPAPAATPIQTPPTPAQPLPTPQPVEHESNEADWEDGGWAAQLLALETTLRPHARLILLAALIAITGLMLVVLRTPVETVPETLPSNMVDSSQAPALTDAHGPALVASEPAAAADEGEQLLDPMPTMPAEPVESSPARAVVTSAGPASMPVAPAMPSMDDITPIPPHRTASTEVAPQPQTELQPQAAPRVAERPTYPSTSYPSTSYSAPAWSGSGAAAPNPNLPRAQLQRPITPSSAGMP